MLVNIPMLELYADNGVNVMFSGRHGVGKTEIIKKVFNKKFKDKWLYYSASTMDAWVHFIGAPKAVTRSDGSEVLKIIPPENLADDNIEALFFDELNRASDATLHAIMELIQFRSINGRKFTNLKVIWAAINPHDEEGTYSVTKLDPAHIDRFPIFISIPYKLDKMFLKKKHGSLALPFMQWWESHTEEIKHLISPRKLDDSINIHKIGGDLSHCLIKESNVGDLRKRISLLSLDDEWKDYLALDEISKSIFMANPSNVEKFEKIICKNLNNCLSLINQDFIVNKINVEENILWIDSVLKCKSIVSVGLEHELIRNSSSNDLKSHLENILKNNNKFGSGTGSSKTSLNLSGKNVAVTGKFRENYTLGNSRDGIKQLLIKIGAIVTESVTRSTDILIAVDVNSSTSKVETANELGKRIISEREFHESYGYL